MKCILLVIVSSFVLSGCEPMQYFSTAPTTHKKHAKRGYNKQYKIKGKNYAPQKHYGYSQVGIASYYGAGDGFHGRKTSTGERFTKDGLTCAHKTLPLPSVVRVTNLKNGRSIKLRVNDRGPFVRGRIIDVSEKAAILLGFKRDGITRVRVECLEAESLHLAHHYNPNNANPYTVMGHGGVTSRSTGLMPHRKPTRTTAAPAQRRTYPGAPRGQFVQVATYKDIRMARAQARSLSNVVKAPCKAYEYDVRGRKMYRVIVGPVQKGQAQKSLFAQLRQRGLKDAFVVTR